MRRPALPDKVLSQADKVLSQADKVLSQADKVLSQAATGADTGAGTNAAAPSRQNPDLPRWSSARGTSMPPSNDRLKAVRRLPMQLLATTIIGSLIAGTLGWLSPYQALGFTASLALAVVLGALARRRTEAVLSAEIRRRRSAEQESKAANRAKSEFLANMSHELRTPLSAVIGTTDLLLGAGLAPDQHRHVEVANNSAESLLALIDDILDFAKLEAGRLRFDAEDFRLRELVEGVRELMAPAAAKKGLELTVEVGAGVPDAVNGDPTRLRQILLNLVGNALKFTAGGRVEIRASGEESHAGSRTCFAVRDTGIGRG